ncbi:MAG: hypothetical protein WCW53_00960 [Syntrophales bacterium]
MSTIGQPERATQNRIITSFRDELGYRYPGDWTDYIDNSNNTENWLLSVYLCKMPSFSPARTTKVAALETKLAKTRSLKQGMMHNLLTRRIRLV